MSSLECLSIQGIRSFSPNDIESIKFQTPLTLIVGANGSGKTTIIECLKYATTGEMPPITKGSGFVTDPQFYNVTTINAMVKLAFKSPSNEIVITRNSSLTLDTNMSKLNFKTTTKTLEAKDLISNQVITHEPSKTAAIEDILSKYIGVSKPILDYVIFAHQEDSLWPLSDSSTLKKRFDEIFEVSRFTKELQNLNQIKKKIKTDIKIRESDLSNARTNMQKAQTIQNRITELNNVLCVNIAEHKQLEIKLSEIENAQNELADINDTYVTIINQYNKLQDDKIDLVKTLQTMVKTYPRILKNESKTNLISSSKILDKSIIGLNRDLNNKYLKTLDGMNEELNEMFTALNALNVKKGTFIHAEKNYKTHKEEVNSLFEHLRTKFNAFEVSSISDLKQIISEKESSLEAYKTKASSIISKYKSETNKLENDIQIYKSKLQHSCLSSNNLEDEISILEKKLVKVRENEVIKYSDKFETLAESKNNLIKAIDTVCSNEKVQELNKEISINENQMAGLEEELKTIRDQILLAKNSSSVSTLFNLKKKEFNQTLPKFEKIFNEVFNPLALSKNMLFMEVQNLVNIFCFLIQDKINDDDYESKNEEFANNFYPQFLEFLSKFSFLKLNLKKDLEVVKEQLSKKSVEEQDFNSKIIFLKKMKVSTQQEACNLEIIISKVMDLSCYTDDSYFADKDNYNPPKIMIDFKNYFETVKQNLKDASDELNLHAGIIKVYEHAKKSITKKNCCNMCNTSFENDSKKLNNAVEYLNKKINTNIETLEEAEDQCKKEYEDYNEIEDALERYIHLKKKEISLNLQIEQEQINYYKIVESKSTVYDQSVKMELKINDVDNIYNSALILRNEVENLKDVFVSLSEASISLKLNSLGNPLKDLDIDSLACQQDNKEEQKRIVRIRINDLNKEKLDIISSKNTMQNDLQKIEYKMATLKKLQEELQELNSQLEKKTSALTIASSDTEQFKTVIKQKNLEYIEISTKAGSYENETQIQIKNDEALLKAFLDSSARLNEYLLPEIQNFEQLYENGFDKVTKQIELLEKTIQIKKNEINDQRKLIDEGKDKINFFTNEINEINCCLEYIGKKDHLAHIINELADINHKEVLNYQKDYSVTVKELDFAFKDITGEVYSKKGEIKQIQIQIETDKNTLNKDYYKIQEKFHEINCNSKTLLNIEHDLNISSQVIESSIMHFHETKMEEINVILDELWRTTYKGSDIATIKIVTEKVTKTQGVESYNYKVVMYKDLLEIDMRGRCSAGQKVMACVLIRLALAETFGVACGVITLDEPTGNLDEENSEGLAESLHKIIEHRSHQQNFQIIIITHDENFIRFMNAQDFTSGFWKVHKDNNLSSKIDWIDIDKLI